MGDTPSTTSLGAPAPLVPGRSVGARALGRRAVTPPPSPLQVPTCEVDP